jgi:hypothetical protein
LEVKGEDLSLGPPGLARADPPAERWYDAQSALSLLALHAMPDLVELGFCNGLSTESWPWRCRCCALYDEAPERVLAW